METASVREASARVIAALSAAGRSRTTIKRHEAELNALARFLQARGQTGGYAAKPTGTLRSSLADFLRPLHQSGQIGEDLAGRLPPQRYPRRGQTAPYPWTAAEVGLVLDQIDRQSAIGKRDYAMVLLTARLGLRVGDLRCLELGWLDWRATSLTPTPHNTPAALRLPVPGDVGWAVVDYIPHRRPPARCAQGFF